MERVTANKMAYDQLWCIACEDVGGDYSTETGNLIEHKNEE